MGSRSVLLAPVWVLASEKAGLIRAEEVWVPFEELDRGNLGPVGVVESELSGSGS